MASGRLNTSDWKPQVQTRLVTRVASKQPREERVLLSRKQPDLCISTYIPPQTTAFDKVTNCHSNKTDMPKEPQVVDDAGRGTWPRRHRSVKRASLQRIATPNTPSRPSSRQSTLSYGILDYYLYGAEAVDSPSLPNTVPGIARFDFGFDRSAQPPMSTTDKARPRRDQDTRPGAVDGLDRPAVASPPEAVVPPPKPRRQRAYSLFPSVSEVPGNAKGQPLSQDSNHILQTDNMGFRTSAQRSSAGSTKPRKEVVSEGSRSRNDSVNSYRSGGLVPLRAISGGSSTSSNNLSQSSTSSTVTSLPDRSRWSDDTVTSPTNASMAGPRTSFSSMLRGSDVQYPDCFFEDDTETVPLTRRFPWKRSASYTLDSMAGAQRQPESPRKTPFAAKLKGILLCSECHS